MSQQASRQMIMSKFNGLRINTSVRENTVATGEGEVNILSPTSHKFVKLNDTDISRNSNLPLKNQS